MNSKISIDSLEKVDMKIFNIDDTIRYLKSGMKNRLIRLKITSNILIIIFTLFVIITKDYIYDRKIILYITIILDIIFLNNGRIFNLIISKRKVAATIDLSNHIISKFCDCIQYYDKNIIEFENISLESNPYIFNKIKSFSLDSNRVNKSNRLVVVICAVDNENIYVIDICDFKEYTRACVKRNKGFFKWRNLKTKKT